MKMNETKQPRAAEHFEERAEGGECWEGQRQTNLVTVEAIPARPYPNLHSKDPELLDKTYLAWLQSADYEPWGKGKTVAKAKTTEAVKQANKLKTSEPRSKAGWQQLLATWQTTPEKVWLWSDLHLFHHRIIQLTGRPFKDEAAMRETMLQGALALQEDDWLVFLGDISFERDWQRMGRLPETTRWLRQIKAHKLLIIGNHDLNLMALESPLKAGFEAVAGSLELPVPTSKPAVLAHLSANGVTGDKLWLTHYPMTQAWLQGNLNIHGHTHQKRYPGPYLNASVEWVDFKPQRLLDLLNQHQP